MTPDVTTPAPSRTRAGAPGTASLLVAYGGLNMVLFPIPIITLFWRDQIGLSLADIMTLQAIFGATAVVMEFPSGYVADRVGHRVSLLIAAVLWLIGWVAYALGATYGAMIVAEVILGVGLAFASGADSALLFTTLQDAERAAEYPRWEGRVRATGQASEALSSAVGGYLYSLSPRLPFWLQIPVAAAALATVIATAEPVRPAAPMRSHIADAWAIIRHTLFRHRRLRTTIALSVSLGLSTFLMVWLIQPYMQRRGIPEVWFGPLWALAHLHLAAMSMASARLADRLGPRTLLAACCVLIPIGYGGLAAGSSAAAVAFYLCFMTIRGLQGPVLMTALQRDAPAHARASVVSLNSLLFRLGFVIIGPPAGAFVDRAGLDVALAVLGGTFTVVAAAAAVVFHRAHAT